MSRTNGALGVRAADTRARAAPVSAARALVAGFGAAFGAGVGAVRGATGVPVRPAGRLAGRGGRVVVMVMLPPGSVQRRAAGLRRPGGSRWSPRRTEAPRPG